MKSERLIAPAPYKLSAVERVELDRQICELENVGVIRKTRSEFGAPAFLVPKPGGSYRLVINYSKLNEQILPDR